MPNSFAHPKQKKKQSQPKKLAQKPQRPKTRDILKMHFQNERCIFVLTNIIKYDIIQELNLKTHAYNRGVR
jgi:hypothetical protein